MSLAPFSSTLSNTPAGDTASRQNLMLLTQLRWIAVIGQVATIVFVHFALEVPLPLTSMAVVIGVLITLNIITLWRQTRPRPVTNTELFAQFLFDFAALTAQLYFSGGAANPFIMLFLLQITLSAVLLEAWSAWVLVLVASAAFLALMGDTVQQPLAVGSDVRMGPFYLKGSFISFFLAASLLVFFIEKINHNLRERDRRLADLRRQAVEEEHIVRMGLLASGAAHELGTPLATLSVILSDWRRMPQIADSPEIAADMDDMQTQLDRCKSIVSGILMSSGEARSEEIVATNVTTFMNDAVEEWRNFRHPKALEYRNTFTPDATILADPALKQVLSSLFDNALDASEHWIGVTVAREDDNLVLTIDDKGPGFSPEILASLGTPYRSTKGRAGGGLGLYLVINVVRKLGGTVDAGNRPDGGASVTLKLPLERLSPGRAQWSTSQPS